MERNPNAFRTHYQLSPISYMLSPSQVSCPKITGIAKKKLLHNFQRTSRCLSFWSVSYHLLPHPGARHLFSTKVLRATVIGFWMFLVDCFTISATNKKGRSQKTGETLIRRFFRLDGSPLVVERHLQMIPNASTRALVLHPFGKQFD